MNCMNKATYVVLISDWHISRVWWCTWPWPYSFATFPTRSHRCSVSLQAIQCSGNLHHIIFDSSTLFRQMPLVYISIGRHLGANHDLFPFRRTHRERGGSVRALAESFQSNGETSRAVHTEQKHSQPENRTITREHIKRYGFIFDLQRRLILRREGKKETKKQQLAFDFWGDENSPPCACALILYYIYPLHR